MYTGSPFAPLGSYIETRPNKHDTVSAPRRVYLHLYRNNERRVEDARVLDQRLCNLHRELQEGYYYEAHAKNYTRFFDIKETLNADDKSPPLKRNAIQQAKQLCGYWILLTNERMTATQALAIYQSKDLIEKSFGNIKERLNGRHLLVSSEKGLNGKLFIQFVPLILISAVNRTMHDKQLYQKYTVQQLLDRLDEVEQFSVDGHCPKVREIQTDQAEIYDQFGVPVPISL